MARIVDPPPADERRQGIGPQAVGLRGLDEAARVEGRQPFAKRVEFPHGGLDGAVAQPASVAQASHPLAEHGEGPERGAREGVPRRGRHVGALHPDAVEGGVLSGEAAEGEPGPHEVGARFARRR